MARFWNFKNIATEAEPENIELRIEGEILSDDDFFAEWFGITGTTPNAFKNELAQYDGKDIDVWINSYGGDVFAAASIYNALKEHTGNVKVKIDTMAMSAASVIAMAGNEIEMSPVSIMMIHNPLTISAGDARDLRKTADVLDEVKKTIVNAYTLKSKRSSAKISQMMDDETYMSAKTAISEGFADKMLYSQIDETAPQNTMMYSKLSIQNSANKALVDFLNKHALDILDTDGVETQPVVDITPQTQHFNAIRKKIYTNY